MKALKWEYEIKAKKGQYLLYVYNHTKWCWQIFDSKKGLRCVAVGSSPTRKAAMTKAETVARDLKLFPKKPRLR